MSVSINYDIDLFIPAADVPALIKDFRAQDFQESLEAILERECFYPSFDDDRNITGLSFEGEKWHSLQDTILITLLKYAKVGSHATWEADGEHGRFLTVAPGLVWEQAGQIEYIYKKSHAR